MQVLVPIEDALYGEAIADFIANHKWNEGTKFHILNVLDFDYFSYAGDPFYAQELAGLRLEREKTAKELVAKLGQQIKKSVPNCAVAEMVIEGPPKQVILQYAEECKAEMIIMGSHGRSGLGRLFLGSVSLAILSQAPCSVLVVRLAKTEKCKQPEKAKEPTVACPT